MVPRNRGLRPQIMLVYCMRYRFLPGPQPSFALLRTGIRGRRVLRPLGMTSSGSLTNPPPYEISPLAFVRKSEGQWMRYKAIELRNQQICRA
jgi:hypothetical protein